MPKDKTPKPRRSARAATQASTRSTRATSSNDEGNGGQPASPPLNITRQILEQEAEKSHFSDEQLAQISSLVSNAVRESLSEVAQRAAKSAVELSSQQISHSSQGRAMPASAEPFLPPQVSIAPSSYDQSLPDRSGFTPEIPSAYVRSIEAGEFFNLSKLLPENLMRLSFDNKLENGDISLVMGPNQELKVKKTNHAVEISKISDWTIAFTTYMRVYLNKFPGKASELINYLDIIQDAARHQKSFAWLIYDRLFRYKASNNKSINWGVRDNDLWIRLCTVSNEQLLADYSNLLDRSVFYKGPSQYSAEGYRPVKRDDLCNAFNRGATCPHYCKYIHKCNRDGCLGPHPGISCPKPGSSTTGISQRAGERGAGPAGKGPRGQGSYPN